MLKVFRTKGGGEIHMGVVTEYGCKRGETEWKLGHGFTKKQGARKRP